MKIESRNSIITLCTLIFFVLSGCSGVQNCSFNPGVQIESKPDREKQETVEESKIESKLPVKVSPKGEVSCNF